MLSKATGTPSGELLSDPWQAPKAAAATTATNCPTRFIAAIMAPVLVLRNEVLSLTEGAV
jgi:hypothetical protein